MKKAALVLFAILGAWAAHAQTVPVYANNMFDGNAPANGTIYFQPALTWGTPASFKRPGGGWSSVTPLSAPVVNGAFALSMPDTTLTSPTNLCFRVTLLNQNGQNIIGPGYTCVQPHGTPTGSGDWCQSTSGCDLDNLAPNIAPQGTATFVGSINGVAGTFTFTGPGVSCTGTVCTFTGSSSGGMFAFDLNGSQVTSSGTVTVSTNSATVASVSAIGSISMNGSAL